MYRTIGTPNHLKLENCVYQKLEMITEDLIFTPHASEAVRSDATFDLGLGWRLRPIWRRPKTHDVAPFAVAFLIRRLKLFNKASVVLTQLRSTFNASHYQCCIHKMVKHYLKIQTTVMARASSPKLLTYLFSVLITA